MRTLLPCVLSHAHSLFLPVLLCEQMIVRNCESISVNLASKRVHIIKICSGKQQPGFPSSKFTSAHEGNRSICLTEQWEIPDLRFASYDAPYEMNYSLVVLVHERYGDACNNFMIHRLHSLALECIFTTLQTGQSQTTWDLHFRSQRWYCHVEFSIMAFMIRSRQRLLLSILHVIASCQQLIWNMFVSLVVDVNVCPLTAP